MTTDRGPDWLSERELAAEREAGTPFDLADCVREQIHRLGGVQTYGALVAARAGVVEMVSANTTEVHGLSVDELIGAPLALLLGDEQCEAVLGLAEDCAAAAETVPVTVGDGREFHVTVYVADGLVVLEFEPADTVSRLSFARTYAPIRQALTRLQRAGSVAEACRAAVREVRAITGYDRVVAYRFDTVDGPGEVIAEDVADDWAPWLGLWFPATDIPPQARRLYEQNWIRVIADVDDPGAGLVPPLLPGAGVPLDLSLSVLRTVSPFHLEYLRNIEVTSSMSVSLLADGRLWGLIACHGRARNRLSPELRAACEFFGVALSLHLAALRERDETAAREQSRIVIARLMETIAVDLPAGWAHGPAGLDGILPCDAVAIRFGGRVTVHGSGVDPAAVARFWAALPSLRSGELWQSDRVGEVLGLTSYPGGVDGALVLPLAGEDGIAWLRTGSATQQRWAIDPDQPVVAGPNGRRLTPRGSTAVYLATVRGRSTPWSTSDLVMAAELGRSIVEVALAHAQAVAALNAELARSNVDLDSFAHAAGHDLKEPLRGIAHTAAFIVEDAGSGLDTVTARRLTAIQRLATRMDELLNSLLHFSRLGRTDLRREDIDLREAVDRALEVAGPRLAEESVDVHRPDAGAVTVHADPLRLDEVLINLLVNAAKYARPGVGRQVTVGGARVTPPGGAEQVSAVYVADNGIGIPAHLRDQAFQLFKRLHAPGEHGGGSGAGLAIVRRLVERHGGQAWADSLPGGGTTIWLTFPVTSSDPLPGAVAARDRQ
jgi:two-component system, chemotaxis family, sensor kinase Cph1